MIDTMQNTVSLLKELKQWLDNNTENISQEVLRMAYLEADYNLALLEVLCEKDQIESTAAAYFDYARNLRLDAMTAVFMNWQKIGSMWQSNGFKIKPRWEKLAEEFAQKEVDNLPRLARYIAVRGSALRALADISPQVRKDLRLRLRLKNLQQALLTFKLTLRENKELEFLQTSL